MANVEIYKLKKTVDPAVREHGMFEFFGMVDGPLPQNYVREWAGELNSGNLDMLCGKFFLNPPDGYHGGPLDKSDIAVVDGETYFLDQESGYKFVEVDFDTIDIKDAVHVEYGYYVNTDGIGAMSQKTAAICNELEIPIGYFSEPDYHGSHKGESSFDPSSRDSTSTSYLHPQFLKGEEARAFVSLLNELSDTDCWGQIVGYLRENYPVNMRDLKSARDKFAPELLLPADLRTLSAIIPADADKSELSYLAAKVGGMDGDQRKVFDAVIEAGWHCGSVAEIINLSENLDCFDLQPSFTESGYGDYRLERDWEAIESVVNRLEKSGNPDERALVKYLTRLGPCVDEAAYGCQIVEEEGGAFTKLGLITEERSLQEIYRSAQDIPAEYRIVVPPPDVDVLKGNEPLIMVYNTDLAALLLEMHAVGGDFMKDAKQNLIALANGGTDYFVMMNDHILTVIPADSLFRRDTSEHETWMLTDKTLDIRTFIISVTEREDGHVLGNFCEADLEALQHYARENSIFFTHLVAKMKDGTSRRFSLEEWDSMGRNDREPILSVAKYYDPADESRLATYLDVLRWAVEENRLAVPSGIFLSLISEPYMAKSCNPQPDMLRVTPEAAKEILAGNAAEVFRLVPDDMEKLSPIDAIKIPMYPTNREFAVLLNDLTGVDKWAQRASGEMLRQNEHGARDKSKNKEEMI